MTFSPFYMGNHTTPFDEHMSQQSYTVAENWGGQINFMVPLDGSLVEKCKAAADRQIAKMALDYELVRALKCAELMQKGFMLMPGSRVYHMCNDVIAISKWTKAEKEVLDKKKACQPPEPKPWYKPWQKPKPKCEMSTLSPYNPPIPKAKHKTSLQRSFELQEAEAAKAEKAKKTTSKKTTTTKSE